eukprot:1048259-Rhodomonas_salina.2
MQSRSQCLVRVRTGSHPRRRPVPMTTAPQKQLQPNPTPTSADLSEHCPRSTPGLRMCVGRSFQVLTAVSSWRHAECPGAKRQTEAGRRAAIGACEPSCGRKWPQSSPASCARPGSGRSEPSQGSACPSCPTQTGADTRTSRAGSSCGSRRPWRACGSASPCTTEA